jgi:hypothetical protein
LFVKISNMEAGRGEAGGGGGGGEEEDEEEEEEGVSPSNSKVLCKL